MNHTASRLLFYEGVGVHRQIGTMVQVAGGEATKSQRNATSRLKSNGFHIDSVQWRV
jgi:hypothetical protein